MLHIRHHEHGALNVYNSLNVTIRKCTFLNNTSDGYYFKRQKHYQGSSGGLSIGYNMSDPSVLLNITITNTDFINNSDSPLAKVTSSRVVGERKFTGRGGGLSVLVDSKFSRVNCTIKKCKFLDNFASNLGGALYILVTNVFNNQSFRLDKVTFNNNSAPIGGALCFIDLRVGANKDSCINTTAVNCTFTNNIADESGGAVSMYSMMAKTNHFVEYEDCEFYNNTAMTGYGGGADFASYYYSFFKARDVLRPFVFSYW